MATTATSEMNIQDPPAEINIAVSSRALFKLETEHKIFEEEGLEAYLAYQLKHENEILETGPAFPFIKVLKHINEELTKIGKKTQFRILLMSHNNAQSAIRLIKSIDAHGLAYDIERGCLTDGTSIVDYLQAYNINLFLTAYANEAKDALEKGIAAAALFEQSIEPTREDQLRIAFDLDAVLFSTESDDVFKKEGLGPYKEHEKANASIPLSEGPLKEFAHSLGSLQQVFPKENNPIRIYAVTARGFSVAERAIMTFRSWGLNVDEVHFLDGNPKGPILKAINPHIFFDDSMRNIKSAQSVGTPAAHVLNHPSS